MIPVVYYRLIGKESGPCGVPSIRNALKRGDVSDDSIVYQKTLFGKEVYHQSVGDYLNKFGPNYDKQLRLALILAVITAIIGFFVFQSVADPSRPRDINTAIEKEIASRDRAIAIASAMALAEHDAKTGTRTSVEELRNAGLDSELIRVYEKNYDTWIEKTKK